MAGDEEKKGSRMWVWLLLVLLCLPGGRAEAAESRLRELLPEVPGMKAEGMLLSFFPETLFEHINGAAEIYLSYDFKELLVAEYKQEKSEETVSVEIYDMGERKNAFGIYSAERYPESTFLPVGTQGYIEEEALNFLVGKYYVKLLCFDCREESERLLRSFAEGIARKVKDGPGFPELLGAFPDKGRLPHSEKFILRNFMGYRFLHDGYLASYAEDGLSFDCFLIEGRDRADAENMLEQFLAAKGASNVEKIPGAFLIRDRYYHTIYMTAAGNILCGVMKIKEGQEETGLAYLKELVEAVGDLKS